jgi:hypothetical protein
MHCLATTCQVDVITQAMHAVVRMWLAGQGDHLGHDQFTADGGIPFSKTGLLFAHGSLCCLCTVLETSRQEHQSQSTQSRHKAGQEQGGQATPSTNPMHDQVTVPGLRPSVSGGHDAPSNNPTLQTLHTDRVTVSNLRRICICLSYQHQLETLSDSAVVPWHQEMFHEQSACSVKPLRDPTTSSY